MELQVTPNLIVLGLVLSSHYAQHRKEQERLRVVAFAFLTPFFFLKGGMSVSASALWANADLARAYADVRSDLGDQPVLVEPVVLHHPHVPQEADVRGVRSALEEREREEHLLEAVEQEVAQEHHRADRALAVGLAEGDREVERRPGTHFRAASPDAPRANPEPVRPVAQHGRREVGRELRARAVPHEQQREQRQALERPPLLLLQVQVPGRHLLR